MTEFKGTKGEWYIMSAKEFNVPYVLCEGNQTLAHIYDSINDNEVEANAQLIAAAPDLLEACIEFVRKCDNGKAKSVKSYKQMKYAINKALKQQP